jgi:hypothetical protein
LTLSGTVEHNFRTLSPKYVFILYFFTVSKEKERYVTTPICQHKLFKLYRILLP